MNRHSIISEPNSPGSPGAVPSQKCVTAPAYSRCPDCDSVFSDRITDEDTGCSYPVDDGEYYCESCDALWTDEALAESSFEEPLVEVERGIDPETGNQRVAA